MWSVYSCRSEAVGVESPPGLSEWSTEDIGFVESVSNLGQF